MPTSSIPRLVLTVCLTALLAGPVHAQSLAEAAAQAKADRATGQQWPDPTLRPTKVYTAADLKDEPKSTVVGTTTPAPAVQAGTETARQDAYRVSATKDEAYWKARMQGLQLATTADALQATAMQQRVRSLTTEFNSTANFVQRAIIRGQRETAITEAARLTATVLADRVAIATAEEEARRAGVPPGWLRP